MSNKVGLRGLVAGLLLAVTTCSPEAGRVRGGGPGADVGNRDAVVEIHGNWGPAFQTPLVGRAMQ